MLLLPALLASLLAAWLAQAAQATPAVTFAVNTTLDETDDNTADNVCHTLSNPCSLRAAVQQVNNITGVVILVPPSTFILTDSVHGDLTLNNSMVISGAGAATTIIQGDPAGWPHRIAHVTAGNDVSIKGVTLEYGNLNGDGGGISNAGFLRLTDSILYSNTAFADQRMKP